MTREIVRLLMDLSGGDQPNPNREPGAVWKGPLRITRGGTYTGTFESKTDVPAVLIETDEPVTLEGVRVRGRGHLIQAPWGGGANVTLVDCHGEALPPLHEHQHPGRFFHAETFQRLEVTECEMVGTSGMYLASGRDGATIRVVRNRARNIDGRQADGGFYRVQFLQVNKTLGLRNSVVAWNEVRNAPWESRPEDVINLHKSGGRDGDPILIEHNLIDGAYPADPTRDGFSGGGILVGDNGGGFVIVRRNTVVRTTNHGIAIAGGTDQRVEDNTVIGSGLLPDGRKVAAQNVGIYARRYGGEAMQRNTGARNRVAVVNAKGDRNDWWVPHIDKWVDNVHLPDASPDAEQAAIDAWAEARVAI